MEPRNDRTPFFSSDTIWKTLVFDSPKPRFPGFRSKINVFHWFKVFWGRFPDGESRSLRKNDMKRTLRRDVVPFGQINPRMPSKTANFPLLYRENVLGVPRSWNFPLLIHMARFDEKRHLALRTHRQCTPLASWHTERPGLQTSIHVPLQPNQVRYVRINYAIMCIYFPVARAIEWW